jgi:hypothetical protein
MMMRRASGLLSVHCRTKAMPSAARRGVSPPHASFGASVSQAIGVGTLAARRRCDRPLRLDAAICRQAQAKSVYHHPARLFQPTTNIAPLVGGTFQCCSQTLFASSRSGVGRRLTRTTIQLRQCPAIIRQPDDASSVSDTVSTVPWRDCYSA